MQEGSTLLKQSEHLMKFFSKYFTLLSTFTRSTAKWSFIVEKEKKQFQIINSKNLSSSFS